MKVSVLMPVHNKAPYLREAVESVLRGSFGDLEIVVVDDASTDDSLDVLRSISDARLRIVPLHENRGPGGAANVGIGACRGEYIARLDADDVASPDRLELQVAYMDAHPDVGASGGSLQLFGEGTGLWSFPAEDDACKAQLLFGVPVSQGASIMRRSVVERHNLRYDPSWPRVGEDWCFWARMAPFTRFGNLERVLVHYRRGAQNISHATDKVATHRVILRHVFAILGIEADAARIDAHLMSLGYFAAPPDGVGVRHLRNWLDELVALNRSRGLFPREAFERRVEQQWDRLFHRLADRGLAPALAHLRLSRRIQAARLVYLVKVRAKALLSLAHPR
jgi:glycosyltransferase involved in cell wall biosynthesis